jgi:hypothetical protein
VILITIFLTFQAKMTISQNNNKLINNTNISWIKTVEEISVVECENIYFHVNKGEEDSCFVPNDEGNSKYLEIKEWMKINNNINKQ